MLLLPSRFPSNGLPESLQRSSNSLPTGRRPVNLTEFEKKYTFKNVDSNSCPAKVNKQRSFIHARQLINQIKAAFARREHTMGQGTTKNAPPDSAATLAETSSTPTRSGDGKERLPTSNNAAKSPAPLRWLGETPDQEHWNPTAGLKERLMGNTSKI